MKTYFFNIRVKLLLYLLLTGIIPIIIFGIVTYNISDKAITEEVTSYTKELLELKKKYVLLFIKEIESLINNISGIEELKTAIISTKNNQAEDTYSRLATQAKIGYILSGYINLRGLDSINVFSMNNQHYHVGSTLNIEDVDWELKERLLQEAGNSDKTILWTGVEKNVIHNSRNENVITAVRLLNTVDPEQMREKPIGLILVQFSTVDFYELIQQTSHHNQHFLIADAADRIIYYRDKNLIGRSLSAFIREKISSSEKSLSTGKFYDTIEGKKMLLHYDRLADNNWSIISFVPVSDIRQPITQIKRITLLSVIFGIIVLIIILIHISRKMIAPINHITNSLRKFQNGDLDLRERFKFRSKDEIGELVKWYNLFLSSLREKKEAEANLEKAREEAIEANDAKSRFLANISHEIRTPMNSIIGFTDLLYEEEQNPGKKMMIEAVKNSGKNLLKLINELLDLSKIEAGKFQFAPHNFSLQKLFKDIENMFSAYNKNLKFEVRTGENLPKAVFGDEQRIRQVLINLTSNAFKFTAAGKIQITCEYWNETAHIEVRDTGIGIPADSLKKIFSPFYQIDAAQPKDQAGTGLGLAIVKKLLEEMDGSIECESEEGKGAVFKITICLPSANNLPDSASDAKESCYSTESLRIAFTRLREENPGFRFLVVDDKKHNRLLIEKILENLNIPCHEAENGKEAIEKLKQYPYDMVLMDINMPVMNGADALKVLKNSNPAPKSFITALTAHAIKGDREKYLQMGFDDYISKPLNIEEFRKTLHQLFIKGKIENKELKKTSSPERVPVREKVDLDTDKKLRLVDVIGVLRTNLKIFNPDSIQKQAEKLKNILPETEYEKTRQELYLHADNFNEEGIMNVIKQLEGLI